MTNKFLDEYVEKHEKIARTEGQFRGEVKGEIIGVNKERYRIVNVMLENNLSYEDISRYTGVSLYELQGEDVENQEDELSIEDLHRLLIQEKAIEIYAQKAQGRYEGRKIGKSEGIEEERSRWITIMLQNNVPDEDISRYGGLPLYVIKNYKSAKSQQLI